MFRLLRYEMYSYTCVVLRLWLFLQDLEDFQVTIDLASVTQEVLQDGKTFQESTW